MSYVYKEWVTIKEEIKRRRKLTILKDFEEIFVSNNAGGNNIKNTHMRYFFSKVYTMKGTLFSIYMFKNVSPLNTKT